MIRQTRSVRDAAARNQRGERAPLKPVPRPKSIDREDLVVKRHKQEQELLNAKRLYEPPDGTE